MGKKKKPAQTQEKCRKNTGKRLKNNEIL